MIRYAKGPVSFLWKDVVATGSGTSRRIKVKQLLWGDWVRVTGADTGDGWTAVSFGGKSYLMRSADLSETRVLEIIFLDVGQGDGAIVTEPGDHPNPRILVVDAGKGANMAKFLNWRFKDFPETASIHACVITHPDNDHYLGFDQIFRDPRFTISHVWHNGLVERPGDAKLGPARDGYLTDIRQTDASLRALVDSHAGSKMTYLKLLRAAALNPKVGPIEGVSTARGEKADGRSYLPGFAPGNPGHLTIEILGPVEEPDSDGRARLRQFGQTGSARTFNESITKNGHSVILKVMFNGFRILMGGDLNRASETFLTLHYGGAEVPPPLTADADPRLAARNDPGVISTAAGRLATDVMKSCHHGSSDVTQAFLKAAQAAAYVISSGDEESHVHPRPDLLGLLGKNGRGSRPLLLSTELLRSTQDRLDPTPLEKLQALEGKIETELALGPEADPQKLKAWREERAETRKKIRYRTVGVYGAVNLRTDGETAVIAFRKEAGAATSRWFHYVMRRDPATNAFLVEVAGD
jgi:beta-lactamase superfamily II metal-dependent hydrolase